MRIERKEPWKKIAFFISVLFIMFMWIKKDIVATYTTMPKEQVIPLFVTTIAVSLMKAAVIAGGVTLIHWTISKIKKQ